MACLKVDSVESHLRDCADVLQQRLVNNRGAAAHSLPSSSIANNRCPLERNNHSNHFPRMELKVAGRTAERWACRKQRSLLRVPIPVAVFMPSFFPHCAFSHALNF